jgi:hypothetical protein
MAICIGIKRSGERCSATARRGESYCLGHSPALAAQRAEGNQRGGQHRSTAARALKGLPPELRAIWQALVELVAEVRSGTAPPPVATAVAVLAGKLLDLAKFSVELGTAQDLEQRLEAVEHATQVQKPVRYRG